MMQAASGILILLVGVAVALILIVLIVVLAVALVDRVSNTTRRRIGR